MKHLLRSSLFVLALMAAEARATDVFERFVEVIGIREMHNNLILTGFETAVGLDTRKGASTRPSEEHQKRIKEIMIEEMGFDTVRTEYISEIRKLFTEQELMSVIDDLEKPAVTAIIRRQCGAFAAIAIKIQLSDLTTKMEFAKRRISREVLGR